MCGKVYFKKKPNSHKVYKWKTYNLPPAKTIQYSSLLEQKKVFYHFIGTYHSQVTHNQFCSILKTESLLAAKDVFILFLPEIRVDFYLGLKISVENEKFIQECNNLLIFLKKSVNLYLSSNNLYVQCKDGFLWKWFYCLYEFFLVKPVTTVISIDFYCSFICSCIVNNEKRLLYLLKSQAKFASWKNERCGIREQVKRRATADICPELLINTCNKNPKYEAAVRIPTMHECQVLETSWHSSSDIHDSGFWTASGKKITVSDIAKQKVYEKFGKFRSSKKKNSEPNDMLSLNNKMIFQQLSRLSPLHLPATGVETLTAIENLKRNRNCQQYSLKEKLKVMENFSNKNMSPHLMQCYFDKNCDSKQKNVCTCQKSKWKKFSNFSYFSISCANKARLSSLYIDMANSVKNKNLISSSDSFSLSFSGENVDSLKHESVSQSKPATDFNFSENLFNEKFYPTYHNDDFKNIDQTSVSCKNNLCNLAWSVMEKDSVEKDITEMATSKQLDTAKNPKNVYDSENVPVNDFRASQADFLRSDQHLPKESGICSEVFTKKHKFLNLGFQTASGKAVSVSTDAVLIAQNIFKEVNCNETEQSLGLEFSKQNLENDEIIKFSKNSFVLTPNCNETKGIKRSFPSDCMDLDATLPESFFEEVSFDDKESNSICKTENVPFQPSVVTPGVIIQGSALGCKRKKSLGGRRR